MLEKLLQFVLKLLPKPLKKIWDKNESLWRYCYYGAWTTVVSMITRFAGMLIFERLGMPVEQSALASGLNTTVSQIITITFAFITPVWIIINVIHSDHLMSAPQFGQKFVSFVCNS